MTFEITIDFLLEEQSPALLADKLYDQICRDNTIGTSPTDPPIVTLIRGLFTEKYAPYHARLRSAMDYAAKTWDPPLLEKETCLAAAMLFRNFSSPESAVSLSNHILRQKRFGKFFSADNPNLDLVIDGIARECTNATVRNRCVELVRESHLQRFSLRLFFALAKADLTVIPLIAGYVFDALDGPPFALNGKPIYVSGFDRALSLADVESIIRVLPNEQVERFSQLFLAHSDRYEMALAEPAILASSRAADHSRPVDDKSDYGPVIIVDKRDLTEIQPTNQSALFLGRMQHYWNNRDAIIASLKALGLREEPMLN